MRKLQKIIAFLLCATMLISGHNINASAKNLDEVISIEDMIDQEEQELEQAKGGKIKAPEEASANTKSNKNRYESVVPLETVEHDEEWDGGLAIFWNPGNSKEFDMDFKRGTMSDSTWSNAKENGTAGSDHADGLTPNRAVHTIRTAVRKAKDLSRHMEVDISDITIYAMAPKVVEENNMYVVDGEGVTVAPWEGREDGSDLVFVVDGGQLILNNLVMVPADGGIPPEEAELVYIRSGKVQLGKKVEAYGTFILDYQSEQPEWGRASSAESKSSDSQTGKFIEPVIELLTTFDPSSQYYLDLWAPAEKENIMAVNALYSDPSSSDEFMELFTLTESDMEEWELLVEERIGGVLRDTTDEFEQGATISEATSTEASQFRRAVERRADTALTQKTLMATRSGRSKKIIYWNPGPAITITEGETYPEGRDVGNDGSTPEHAVKSWVNARNRANGGIVVCMQSIDLANDATDVLGPLTDGSYVLDGLINNRVTLSTWERSPVPVLIVPAGVTVTLRNLNLTGQTRIGQFTGTEMMRFLGGKLNLESNVRTISSYVQLNLEDHQLTYPPITVDDVDVMANLFIGGINDDIDWRYQDVAVAGDQLLQLLGNDYEAAGDLLLARITLEAANRLSIDEGGLSKYKWSLRKDTADDGAAEPHHLELYSEYYFEAVYLDGVSGIETNYGSTCQYPVLTFQKAREILEYEIGRSIAARAAAADRGESVNSISLPTTLYICDTVTVANVQNWQFPDFNDYNGDPIKVEIKPHIAHGGGNQTPENLIMVNGTAGRLTLGKNIFIRSIADKSNSYSVIVTGGGSLTFDLNAVLTGLVDQNASAPTKGKHILLGKNQHGVISSGVLVMTSQWTGSIDSREMGIESYGSQSTITMNSGTIKNNHNPDDIAAGVYLGPGVKFYMYGGNISENSTNMHGAGVYLDSQAVFEMKEGVIEKNTAQYAGTTISTDGVGVYIGDNAKFTMGNSGGDHAAARISENSSNGLFKGLGVFVKANGTFTMLSGTIDKNRGVGAIAYSNVSRGAGIYNEGIITIQKGIITDNGFIDKEGHAGSIAGAGLYLNGTSQIITGADITYNTSRKNAMGNGGGIYIGKAAAVNQSTVSHNSGAYGGGVYISSGISTASRIELKDTKIQNNTSLLTYGGGIYTGSELRITGGEITGNSSPNYGGGIYAETGKIIYCIGAKISGNSASYGAGVYTGGDFYATDTEIINNAAKYHGGGIYLTNGSHNILRSFHLSESSPGKSKLSGNTAIQGGGIYLVNGTIYLDITNPIQNKAVSNPAVPQETQGNNIYQRTASNSILDGTIYLLTGSIVQPGDSEAEVYNIFLSSVTDAKTSSVLVIDPTVATVGGENHIYLDSSNAYIKYLKAPPSNGSLPIALNGEAFDVGSIVVKPASLASVLVKRVNSANTALENAAKGYIIFSALTTANARIDTYSAGSKVPQRTYLGIYGNNIVLLAKGVYLSGSGRSNATGLSPDDPVNTFEKAVAILQTQTNNANNAGGEGFMPIIYICGTVTVSSGTWTLDYDRDIYADQDVSAYVKSELAAGRVPEKAQIKRFTSFINAPMVKVEGGSNGAALTISKLIIDGMSKDVVRSDQTNRSPMFTVASGRVLKLLDETQLKNNSMNMLNISGTLLVHSDTPDGKIVNGTPFVNRQIEVVYGDGVNLSSGAKMEMSGHSKLIMTDTFTNTYSSGYHVQGYKNRGVVVSGGASLTMKDDSKLQFTNEAGEPMNPAAKNIRTFSSIGVYIGEYTRTASAKAVLNMDDRTSISCFYAGIGLNNYMADINLTGAAVIGGADPVFGNTYGIIMDNYGVNNINISLAGQSKIRNNLTSGLRITSTSAPAAQAGDTVNLKLMGYSSIQDNVNGIDFEHFSPRLKIDMTGFSSIVNNSKAGLIQSRSIGEFELNMSDDVWIGSGGDGVQRIGIKLDYNNKTSTAFKGDRTDKYRIKMSGNAMIGGQAFYTSAAAKKGNELYGIVSDMPITIEMKENSKIQYNGDTGVHLSMINSAMYSNYTGMTNITIGGDVTNSSSIASINNNGRYGINSQEKNNNGEDRYKETITVTKNGAVMENPDGNTFMSDSSLYLKESAKISNGTVTEIPVINMFGSLYMDGTVDIEGVTQLQIYQKPITLTKAIPSSGSVGKYKLLLSEGHVGEVVVRADGSGVTDAAPYVSSFTNETTAGIASGKLLVPSSPNIILDVENNVFISGNGNDTMTGMSPATAVRTFNRAKWLLENGNFSDGANIVICDVPGQTQNVPVQIAVGDEDWSFTDGTVTNGADTWTPNVIRHENYAGPMIELNQGEATATGHIGAASVNFGKIIIDGGSSQAMAETVESPKMTLNVIKGEASLAAGAVLQNNRIDLAGISEIEADKTIPGVYVQAQGKLVLDGGIIRQMKIENIETKSLPSLGAAIYNEGIVQVKQGAVQNNEVVFGAVDNREYGIAAAVLNRLSGKFIMEGGSLDHNTVHAQSLVNVSGGAVAFEQQAEGEIKEGLIRDNQGGKGAALFYSAMGAVELAGGRIQDNTALNHPESTEEFSAVFIDGARFKLKVGGTALDESIYLTSVHNIITISGHLAQTSKKYKVYLNKGDDPDQFKKGSVVVQPDGTFVLDASQFLIYFDVHANPFILDRGQSIEKIVGTLSGIRENQCLLLMQAVFIDSLVEHSNDDGTCPENAVKTFARAKDLGEGTDKSAENRDYFIIYISGAVHPADGEIWELSNSAYMCRYTGFQIYHSKKGEEAVTHQPYHGYLIETQGDLTIQNIRIMGRRAIDDNNYNGDSIILVSDGHQVDLLNGAELSRNYNIGSYIETSGMPVGLQARGGAVRVQIGGTLNILGGNIEEVYATFGDAVYVEAGALSTGRVKLDHSPNISGDIYLYGGEAEEQAYIEVTDSYQPYMTEMEVGALRVRMENVYSGRPVIKYPDGIIPTPHQIGYYQLDDSVKSIYDFNYDASDNSLLTLQLRQLLYVDEVGGHDGNDGLTPENALKTIKGVYQKIPDIGADTGVLVFVVNSLTVEMDITLTNELKLVGDQMKYSGSYQDSDGTALHVPAQVYFKRYARPIQTTKPGYNVETNENSLFIIKDGATLEFNGIYIDGHSEKNLSNMDYVRADGVEAKAPLIVVEPGGILEAGYSLPSNSDGDISETTYSYFSNNKNITRQKQTVIGSDGGEAITEGISAGIEILSNQTKTGKAVLEGVEFRNLTLTEDVYGGSDVYQNGELIVYSQTIFSGSVLLEGVGSTIDTSSSRYIQVLEYGTPFKNNFKLIIRDPYDCRKVIEYPNDPNGPADRELGVFLLEEAVSRYYALQKRVSEKYILELKIPDAVYINGQTGDDKREGYVPAEAVKTLKRAYEQLKKTSGRVIYVVDTVNINQEIELSAGRYVGEDGSVTFSGGNLRVDIRRFIRPIVGDASSQIASTYRSEYDEKDHMDVLFRIQSGGSVTLKENVHMDGHYDEFMNTEYSEEFLVDHVTEVTSPLIEVQSGGELFLESNTSLTNNYNIKTLAQDETRFDGGAIYNSGKVELRGAVIEDNKAPKGAGIYQNGSFTIISNPAGIKDQEIYLTTINTGTAENPVWGTDRTLNSAILLANNLKLDIQMDHAVAGRPVVKYTSHANVDPQHVHYRLGDTVPLSLFLIERATDSSMLELQDWKFFDVTIPKEMFLVILRNEMGNVDVARGDSPGSVLTGPEYSIKNNSAQKIKLALAGFINDNANAGITDFDSMNLVALPSLATDPGAARNDLYLAVKGIDTTGGFSALTETSLHSFGTDGAVIQTMGSLDGGEEGKFIFKATASEDFLSYYADPGFPLTGAAAEERIAHFRHQDPGTGVTSANKARAKFKMTYRIALDPGRR